MSHTNDSLKKFLFVSPGGPSQEGGTAGGGIFITNVTSTSVVNKTMNANGYEVDSFFTDLNTVTVTVEWDGTAEDYRGSASVWVKDVEYPVGSVTRVGTGIRRFTGTAVIDVSTLADTGDSISAVHSSGRQAESGVQKYPAGPTIASTRFIGGYPGVQTEVKVGNTYQVEITFNPTGNSVATMVDVISGGAASAATSIAVTPVANKATITVTIAASGNQGNSPLAKAVSVKAKNAYGTYGNTMSTNDSGAGVDGVNTVFCNDQAPTVAFGVITYPANQGALKGYEQAQVGFTCGFFSSVAYAALNGDITISNPSTYEALKTVTRAGGSYNVGTSNFQITAYRAANGTSYSMTTVVRIANALPSITVTEQYARLRSSSTAQSYTITISSDQQLYSAPTLAVASGGNKGAWAGGAFTGGPTVYTRSIQVVDSDTKGTHAWGALAATNLAGLVQTTISGDSSYTLGGFLRKTLTVSAYSREVAIGTKVSNIAKLQCTNLSKGSSGSLNYTYKSYTDGTVLDPSNDTGVNFADQYTITSPSNTALAAGDIWFNLDRGNSGSNTQGTMQVEIEEVV